MTKHTFIWNCQDLETKIIAWLQPPFIFFYPWAFLNYLLTYRCSKHSFLPPTKYTHPEITNFDYNKYFYQEIKFKRIRLNLKLLQILLYYQTYMYLFETDMNKNIQILTYIEGHFECKFPMHIRGQICQNKPPSQLWGCYLLRL